MKSNLFSTKGIGRYLKNTAWVLSEKAFRIVDAFFIGIWIARYLGPEEFGILSYAESFIYLFTAIATLGLDQIVIKELVKSRSKLDEILGTTFVLRIIGFVIMFSLILISLTFLDNTNATRELILIISFSVALQSFKGIDFYFQSKVLSKYVTIANSVAVGIVALVKIALILSNAPLVYFGYAIVLEWLLIAISYMIAYSFVNLTILKWTFQIDVARELLSKSWPLIIGSIAAALYMKIDQVMIKEILDERAVGIYSVAVRLTSIWIFVTVAITQSVFPALVRAYQDDVEVFYQRLQKLYDVLIKIAFVVCIIYFIFAQYFVPFLFGDVYSESTGVLVIYIWSIIFVFLSNASWSFYLNEGLERFSSVRLIIGAVLNIFINVYFIEWYGLKGAAYATLISYAVSGYLVNALFSKTKINFKMQSKAFLHIFKPNTWSKPL